MKRIPLSQGKVAIVDDEDFEYLDQWEWCFLDGYAVRLTKNGGKQVRMHRLLNKTPDGLQCNHIDGKRLNNQKYNLRDGTHSQITWSRGSLKGSSSKYKGVSLINNKYSGKWIAKICHCGQRFHLGIFINEEDAAIVYDYAAKEKFGEFARLNFNRRPITRASVLADIKRANLMRNHQSVKSVNSVKSVKSEELLIRRESVLARIREALASV